MSDTDYAVVDPDGVADAYEGTEVPGEFRRLTGALGCEQLAATLIRVPPHSDFEQGTGHHHQELEELYVVTRGRATFELDGERLEAPTGTFVYVRPGVTRTAFADEPGTTIVAVGGVPGQAYEPDGWELWAPLRPLYEAGSYAEVADRGRELIEANPQYGGPMYNLACCEALAGRTQDAIEHLRLAFERSDQLRSVAKEDSDLDSIRDENALSALVYA